MEPIFELESLDDLSSYLHSQPAKRLRGRLIKEFRRCAVYTDARQWNRAVRLCEALAIIGWGEHEAVEAVRDTYYNGWPTTTFYNRHAEKRYREAMWSKRKSGLQVASEHVEDHGSPDVAADRRTAATQWGPPQDVALQSQRNWIAKNPILLAQTVVNCYPSSDNFVRAVQRLMGKLDREMDPECYGHAINRIEVYYHLSYREPGCATNYVIDEASAGLSAAERTRQLKKRFTAREIREMSYQLVPRYLFRPFRAATGRMNISIHLPQEFSDQPTRQQKREFAKLVRDAIAEAATRLTKKRLAYDFAAMQLDLDAVLKSWGR